MSKDAEFIHIDDGLINRKIQAPEIICEHKIDTMGSTCIPAPTGVTFDLSSGQFTQEVIPKLVNQEIPILRTIQALPDRVAFAGVVPIHLFVDQRCLIPYVEIPFRGFYKCPGVVPSDLVKFCEVQIHGFIITPVQQWKSDCMTMLFEINTFISFEFQVLRKKTLRVESSEVFC